MRGRRADAGNPLLTTRILMDVDTGVDDALAIFLASRSPELKVEGVTTVVGNVSLDRVLRNTLHVTRLAGLSGVPVYRGAAKPLASEVPGSASFVHGSDGLGGASLPEPATRPAEGFAPDVICEMARKMRGSLALVTTGPLTNLALAIQQDPEALRGVGAHVMMGGAFSVTPYGHGNITPAAEFNVWHDPEAARVVFGAGLPTVAVGLDVTTDPRASMTEDHLKMLDQRGEAGGLVQKLARACLKAGGQLHDPMAVAYVIAPELFRTEDYEVGVEATGALTRGETVADRRDAWRKTRLRDTVPQGRATVCTAVDGKKFLKLFTGRLADLTVRV